MSRANLEYEKIKEMRKDRKTIAQIALEFDVSVPTIQRFIKRNNMQLKEPYQTHTKMCHYCRKYFYKEDFIIKKGNIKKCKYCWGND